MGAEVDVDAFDYCGECIACAGVNVESPIPCPVQTYSRTLIDQEEYCEEYVDNGGECPIHGYVVDMATGNALSDEIEEDPYWDVEFYE